MTMDDDAVILVCLRADEPNPWKATNLIGACAICGAAVQYRPHAPTAVTRMCVPCFTARASRDDTYIVTRRTLAEVDAERRKN